MFVVLICSTSICYKVEYSVYSMEVNMKINNLDPTFLYIYMYVKMQLDN